MSTEIQSQLEDLKQRVADLEKAEIKLRIQSVGPRGPIGPAGVIGERGPQGVGQPGANGANGADGRDGKTPNKEQLDSFVCQILHDYGVLEDGGLGQILKYEITKAVFEAVQKELPKALASAKVPNAAQ
jgi:hypothetical protein